MPNNLADGDEAADTDGTVPSTAPAPPSMSLRLPRGCTPTAAAFLLAAFVCVDAERNDKKKPGGGLQIGNVGVQDDDDDDLPPAGHLGPDGGPLQGALVQLSGRSSAYFASQQRARKEAQGKSATGAVNSTKAATNSTKRAARARNRGRANRSGFIPGHVKAREWSASLPLMQMVTDDSPFANGTNVSDGLQSFYTADGHRIGARASPRSRSHSTVRSESEMSWSEWIVEVLFAIGGGTGATIGGTGNPELDQDMVRRMRYQDKAVMLVLLVAYTGSLIFSASLAYRQASNNSPVTYYADPRQHNMVVDSPHLEHFLDTFNQPPKDVHLQVSGFVPLQDPELMNGNVDWYGVHYHVAFSFALDLSPWVVRGGIDEYHAAYYDMAPHEAGVNREDLARLRDFLVHNNNDLAIVELRKTVVWTDWEELATNIKHQIRQSGFGGIISVHRSENETVHVYKNKPWANFMHSRTTKVLWALSLVGWIFYQPYMWLRCTSTLVRSFYRIDIPIQQFWPFIEDKIGVDGFNDRSQQNAAIASRQ